MEFKHLKREKVFQNMHLSVFEENLILPDGQEVKWTFLGDYLAVGIIAFTPEKKLLMVKQYRPAIKQELIELPAGLVDPGEDIEDAAMRELEEETGYRAGKIEKVCEYFRNPGISSSKMIIYFAQDLVKTEQKLDQCEFLDVLKIDIESIDEILQGPIDGKTLYALNYIKANSDKMLK